MATAGVVLGLRLFDPEGQDHRWLFRGSFSESCRDGLLHHEVSRQTYGVLDASVQMHD